MPAIQYIIINNAAHTVRFKDHKGIEQTFAASQIPANLSNGNSPKGVATEAQVKFLSQLLVGKDEIKNSLLKAEGVENLSQLSFDMVSKAITKLKGQ